MEGTVQRSVGLDRRIVAKMYDLSLMGLRTYAAD